MGQLKQSINSSTVFLEKSKEFLIKPKPKEPKVENVIETWDQQSDDAKNSEESQDKEKSEEKKDEEKVDVKDGKSDTKEETKEKAKAKSKIDEDGLFKEKELDSLKKKIAEVEKWRDEKLDEQAKTPLSEMPKLTVSMIKSKIQDLDSEVQFLIQKARMLKAEKEREKRKL